MADDPLAAWLRGRQDAEPPQPGDGPGSEGSGNVQDTWAAIDDELADASRAEPAGARRRTWLVAAAALPWLVVAVLALTPPRVGGSAQGPGGRPGAAPPTAGSGQPAPAASAPDAAPAAGEHVARSTAQVEAAAAVTVRTALTGTGEDGDRYVDLALPAGSAQVGDVTVVTVAAVVLDGSDGRWHRARAARYAVPMRHAGGAPAALAAPWPLAQKQAAAPVPRWEPVEDPVLADAAGAALDDAGYRELADVTLGRAEDVPGVLRVQSTAVAPGEDGRAAHELWLSDGPSPALLGDASPASLTVRSQETP